MKNRHPRQSAGVWARLALEQEAPVPKPPPPTEQRVHTAGYDREVVRPVRRRECAQRRCAVLTANRFCSAHGALVQLRGIRSSEDSRGR